MKVKSPLMSIDARGGMGPGVVLGKYRGTNTGRMRIRTPIRRSSKEQNVRNNLAMGAGAWGLISETDRNGWNVYAKTIDRINVFGQIYHATGQAEYLGIYSLCRLIGIPIRITAPVGNIPPLIINLVVAAVSVPYSGFVVTWDWWSPAMYVEIMVSGAKNWTEEYYKNEVILRVFKLRPETDYVYRSTRENSAWGWACRYITIEGQRGPWSVGVVKVP